MSCRSVITDETVCLKMASAHDGLGPRQETQRGSHRPDSVPAAIRPTDHNPSRSSILSWAMSRSIRSVARSVARPTLVNCTITPASKLMHFQHNCRLLLREWLRASASGGRRAKAWLKPQPPRGIYTIPESPLKCAVQRSARGLYSRAICPEDGSIDDRSVPMYRLQIAQRQARFCKIVSPPCLKAITWST